ncbi:MAG: hypothetical protein IJN92_05945 [Lachnospiraceae bacterium]|nr:hypothetical protein [Lachnospiraceae bacterium]
MALVQEGLTTAEENMSAVKTYLSEIAANNSYTEETKGLFSSITTSIEGNIAKVISAIEANATANSGTISDGQGGIVSGNANPNSNKGNVLPDVKQTVTLIQDTNTPLGRQDAENNRINQVNAVKNFIAENAVDADKSKSKYTDVNQKIWEDKAEAYDGKGKILNRDALNALCLMLGIAHNNGSKTGNLYKKLQSIKFPGFSKGGVVKVDDIEKQVKANGDNVLISARKDETILSPAQSEMFKKFTDNLPQLNMTAEMFNNTVTLPKIPDMTPIRNMGNNVLQIDTVTLPNVTNWEEFKDKMYKDMQSNRKFEGLVQDVSINRLSGGGRLSKNRQKF